eukprot:774364-Amphidinium_carterae.1
MKATAVSMASMLVSLSMYGVCFSGDVYKFQVVQPKTLTVESCWAVCHMLKVELPQHSSSAALKLRKVPSCMVFNSTFMPFQLIVGFLISSIVGGSPDRRGHRSTGSRGTRGLQSCLSCTIVIQ